MYASSQLIRAKEQGRTDSRIPIPIEENIGDPDIEKSHQLTINEDLIEPERFLRLKGCLENKSNGTDICDELLKEMDPIIRLPPVQFQKLCKQFDMSQLSDDTLRVFCNELVKRDDIIFQNYVILFRMAYLDKIRQLASMPSRSLISSILNIARIKGRALVEALLLPLLNDANSIGIQYQVNSLCFYTSKGRPQLDIIQKVNKQGLDEISILAILRVITQETRSTSSGHTMTDPNSTYDRCFSEAIVETIIAILDQKFHIDDTQLMRQFLLRLEASIELQPDNKKLAQILLLLVTKHSVDLLQELQYVKEIAEKTKTFLKRTVLSHIANLEKNV
ncbi:10621_t:CDS:2 [Paraglomus brasilianum]|uniref:10621_t:CDS:1 n=1 Tax=Paraglomus brasilianum TaxID=144538 RepID=A0A9N9D5W2_9GLOM|nr:10621_t:CDS:2 [Paraglomus brasilianum]